MGTTAARDWNVFALSLYGSVGGFNHVRTLVSLGDASLFCEFYLRISA